MWTSSIVLVSVAVVIAVAVVRGLPHGPGDQSSGRGRHSGHLVLPVVVIIVVIMVLFRWLMDRLHYCYYKCSIVPEMYNPTYKVKVLTTFLEPMWHSGTSRTLQPILSRFSEINLTMFNKSIHFLTLKAEKHNY